MLRLRQGLQPVVKPNHAHEEAHRIQALRMRPLREGIPAKGGPPPTPREPASGPRPRAAATSDPPAGAPSGGHLSTAAAAAAAAAAAHSGSSGGPVSDGLSRPAVA